MLACTREKWFNAACYFMLAGVFRSNGVLLAGFITWGLIVQPYFDSRNFVSTPYACISHLTDVSAIAIPEIHPVHRSPHDDHCSPVLLPPLHRLRCILSSTRLILLYTLHGGPGSRMV
jgi:phosphatidylinositol glycan class V